MVLPGEDKFGSLMLYDCLVVAKSGALVFVRCRNLRFLPCDDANMCVMPEMFSITWFYRCSRSTT